MLFLNVYFCNGFGGPACREMQFFGVLVRTSAVSKFSVASLMTVHKCRHTMAVCVFSLIVSSDERDHLV